MKQKATSPLVRDIIPITPQGPTFDYNIFYFLWCTSGQLIWYIVSCLVMLACLYIPERDTQSAFFEKFYYRGATHNTTYFDVGNLIGYSLLNILGSLYVNIVTLTNERSNPLLDHHFKMNSFFKTVFFSNPVLFLTSMMVNLTGQEDLDGFCDGHHSIRKPISIS